MTKPPPVPGTRVYVRSHRAHGTVQQYVPYYGPGRLGLFPVRLNYSGQWVTCGLGDVVLVTEQQQKKGENTKKVPPSRLPPAKGGGNREGGTFLQGGASCEPDSSP